MQIILWKQYTNQFLFGLARKKCLRWWPMWPHIQNFCLGAIKRVLSPKTKPVWWLKSVWHWVDFIKASRLATPIFMNMGVASREAFMKSTQCHTDFSHHTGFVLGDNTRFIAPRQKFWIWGHIGHQRKHFFRAKPNKNWFVYCFHRIICIVRRHWVNT